MTTQAGQIEVDSRTGHFVIATTVLGSAVAMLTATVVSVALYLTDVFPALTVFGFGLAMSVAPVTATALTSVPEERSGAASGANNAIARTGRLLTVAVVPPLGGLTGDALNVAEQLNEGFGDAMVVAAALVASGSLVSALGLRRSDLTGVEDSAR